MQEMPDRKTAIGLLQKLRSGTPKAEPATIRFLHVGREKWLDGIQRNIDEAVEADASATRFVRGDYGSGKSHFLMMTMWQALHERMLASYVSIEDQSQIRGFDFELVWRAMVQQLAIPGSQGAPDGLSGVLERWCTSVEDIPTALRELDSLTGLEVNFRQSIRGYLQSHFQEGDKAPYQQWLQGDSIKPPGIKAKIDQRNSPVMLRSLCVFAKHIGYGGLMLLLDELELIQEQSRRVRAAAYESLRQLVDNPLDVPGFVFVGAATPDMFVSYQGLQEYQALWQRSGLAFGLQSEDEQPNYRGVVVDLERDVLDEPQLIQIAKNVRTIHGIADSWDAQSAVDDAALQELSSFIATDSAEVGKPRWLVATIVDVLDRKEQDPTYDIRSRIPEEARAMARRVRKQEQARHRQIGEA